MAGIRLIPTAAAGFSRRSPLRRICENYGHVIVNEIPFEDLVARLPPEALGLFQEMAAAHLESTGNRLFLRSDTFGGKR